MKNLLGWACAMLKHHWWFPHSREVCSRRLTSSNRRSPVTYALVERAFLHPFHGGRWPEGPEGGDRRRRVRLRIGGTPVRKNKWVGSLDHLTHPQIMLQLFYGTQVLNTRRDSPSTLSVGSTKRVTSAGSQGPLPTTACKLFPWSVRRHR